ncbi:MAG: hypothetical protein U5P41_10725 [Gammaproteobacteria bacterium]|nr:hypothetical protein [Gammaproteobacteria bacterium]
MKRIIPVARLLSIVTCGVLLLAAGACSMQPARQGSAVIADVLYVYNDGTMKLNDRSVDPANVVIYPDGFGGEKAALKMRVPLHPDYYRDTIVVERKTDPADSIVD